MGKLDLKEEKGKWKKLGFEALSLSYDRSLVRLFVVFLCILPSALWLFGISFKIGSFSNAVIRFQTGLICWISVGFFFPQIFRKQKRMWKNRSERGGGGHVAFLVDFKSQIGAAPSPSCFDPRGDHYKSCQGRSRRYVPCTQQDLFPFCFRKSSKLRCFRFQISHSTGSKDLTMLRFTDDLQFPLSFRAWM